MRPFRFHPEARAEARAAAAWYRERSTDTARQFTRAVTEGVQSIRQHPQAWARWDGTDVRRRVLPRFPYSVFYVFERDIVVIAAVAHHKRQPGYWLPRLGR